ncbi:hypothetical protein EYF80_030746 [Liparis tanakae]|uniref:Uncharacterized protein n=1 Tax=Liparis tanakae TaxID=230148 RepID=A0A4Z2GZH3_9TELE|nr:hypothetical protein EYF80_030746 [Liparis tanakae]
MILLQILQADLKMQLSSSTNDMFSRLFNDALNHRIGLAQTLQSLYQLGQVSRVSDLHSNSHHGADTELHHFHVVCLLISGDCSGLNKELVHANQTHDVATWHIFNGLVHHNQGSISDTEGSSHFRREVNVPRWNDERTSVWVCSMQPLIYRLNSATSYMHEEEEEEEEEEEVMLVGHVVLIFASQSTDCYQEEKIRSISTSISFSFADMRNQPHHAIIISVRGSSDPRSYPGSPREKNPSGMLYTLIRGPAEALEPNPEDTEYWIPQFGDMGVAVQLDMKSRKK